MDVLDKKKHISLRIKLTLLIAALVSLMLCILSFYFLLREASILEENFIAFAKGKLTYFQNITQESLSCDNEFALSFFINDLKNNQDNVLYAVVTKSDGTITSGFDKRGKLKIGSVLADGVVRKNYLQEYAKEKKLEKIIYTAANGKDRIYDFSAPVVTPFDNKAAGFVIIGFSDLTVRDEITLMVKQLAGVSLGFIVVFAAGVFLLLHIIIKPIKKLLDDTVIQIRASKHNDIKNLTMQDQLDVARSIQESLNPMAYYHKGGIQIKGFMRAAQDVGGDYFDYVDIDENRIGVLISDVAGKGVPASLLMVMIRTIFATYIKRTDDIDSVGVINVINDLLSADFGIDKFVTLFFFIYDREKEELSFSNAGHGPLYRFRARDGAIVSTKLDGMPIGIMGDAKYLQAKVSLEPGDIIMMFTDGVTEMRNIDKKEYGRDRIFKMLAEKHHMSADDIVKSLVDDIDDFRKDAPPHDDMTVVVFKRNA